MTNAVSMRSNVTSYGMGVSRPELTNVDVVVDK